MRNADGTPMRDAEGKIMTKGDAKVVGKGEMVEVDKNGEPVERPSSVMGQDLPKGPGEIGVWVVWGWRAGGRMLRQGKEVGAKLAEEELSNIQNHTELLCTCMAVNSTVNVALFESRRHFMHSKIKRGNCIASLHFVASVLYCSNCLKTVLRKSSLKFQMSIFHFIFNQETLGVTN